MKSVAVLMSTYNGETFITNQIESILNQKDVNVYLFIRDDGSSDNTTWIIKHFAKNNKVSLIHGSNIGVGNSFMNLVKTVGNEFDYYAFSDQDDIWLEDKLIRAIEMIEKKDNPVLYCSNQMLIDKEGNRIGKRHLVNVNTHYLRILNDNDLSGCTMVWNNQLQALLADPVRFPSKYLLDIRIHDVWVAMVASVVGEIVYDDNAYILYRQHEDNYVGVKKSSLMKEWRKKIQNPSLRNGRSYLAKEIISKYGDLMALDSYNQLQMCSEYQTDCSKKMNLLRNQLMQSSVKENYNLFRLKVILNLF